MMWKTEKDECSALAITTGISGNVPSRKPRKLNARESRKDRTERGVAGDEGKEGRKAERNVLYVKTISAIKITAARRLR